jgi:hypothetical protein
MQGDAAKIKLAAGMEHINEHLAYLYRARVEMELGVPLPALDDEEQHLTEDQELAISRLVAEAAPRITGKAQQKAQAEQAQQQAQDPVIQMQQRELQLQEQELQRKVQKDQMDHQIKLAQVQIEAARVQSQEKQAGAAMGAKIASDSKKVDADLKKAGLKAGVDLSKR